MIPKPPKGSDLYNLEQELSVYRAEDMVVEAEELRKKLKAKGGVFNVPTGIDDLDRITSNAEAGEMIIVTGPTGEGKTTLLMTITDNMAKAGVDALWFTLEVTPRQFIEKMSMRGGMPKFYIPSGDMDAVDDNFLKAWEARNRRKMSLVDWIEIKIIETKVKYETEDRQLKAVFIDHINAIFAYDTFRSTNVSLELGDLAGRIKNLAIHYGLVIYLIAHLKDPADGRQREPRKQDIRDSGLISRLADTIIGVWRIPNESDGTKPSSKALGENDNKAKIAVFKNRRTGKLGFFTAYHADHAYTTDPF